MNPHPVPRTAPRTAPRSILAAAAAFGLALALHAGAEEPAPGAQPTQIPGNWEWSPVPLPPIGEIVSRPTPDRPVYGLYCWESEYREHHGFIRDIGWRNFRLSGPISDEVMKLYAEDGAEVMFTMAARRPFPTAEHPQGEWRNRRNYESDEAFVADYLGDVTKVLSRYGPGGTFWKENPGIPQRPLRHIEIFNEPNFWYLDMAREDTANHFPPKDAAAREAQNAARQALYAKLLAAAYPHVKASWPDVNVVGFGAGGAAGADVPFVRGVHASDPAVAASYDILSTHPYVRPAPPEGDLIASFGKVSIGKGTAAIREIMAAAGTSAKPLWWTELNWTIFPEKGGAFDEVKLDPRRKSKDTTPDLQAAFLVRGYALALRLGVARLHYMSVVDTDNVNSGMIDATGKYRPAAIAAKTMIATMPNPRLLGAVAENEDGIYIYRFDPDFTREGDAEVVMAYRVQGPKTVSIPWDGPAAERVGMLGETSMLAANEGALSLEIGPLPVYLRQVP
jgi:hypothetical protein